MLAAMRRCGLRRVIWPHMSVEPLLSRQILSVRLERERVELRGYESRRTWGGPRHYTGEHNGHGDADQDDFAHLIVLLTMRRFVFKPPLR